MLDGETRRSFRPVYGRSPTICPPMTFNHLSPLLLPRRSKHAGIYLFRADKFVLRSACWINWKSAIACNDKGSGATQDRLLIVGPCGCPELCRPSSLYPGSRLNLSCPARKCGRVLRVESDQGAAGEAALCHRHEGRLAVGRSRPPVSGSGPLRLSRPTRTNLWPTSMIGCRQYWHPRAIRDGSVTSPTRATCYDRSRLT